MINDTAWQGGFAIDPSGVLYHVEQSSGGLVGVNLGFGEGARVALPRGRVRVCSGTGPTAPGTCTETPAYGAGGTPTVLSDGTVVVPVDTSTHATWLGGGAPSGLVPGISLFRLHPDGTTTTEVVQPSDGAAFAQVAAYPYKAIPNGDGGVVVGWVTRDTIGDVDNWRPKVAAVLADGTVSGSVGVVGARLADMVLGENGQVLVTTYLSDGRKAGVTVLTTSAVTVGFETLATREVSTVMAEEGGGFLVNYSDGTMLGSNPEFASMPLSTIRYHMERWLGALTTTGHTVASMAGPPPGVSSSAWPNSNSDQLGSNAEKLILHVEEATSTGPAADLIASRLISIRSALTIEQSPGSCAPWLLNMGDEFIELILAPERKFGHVIILDQYNNQRNEIIAFRYGVNSDRSVILGLPISFAIAVNINSAFFHAADPMTGATFGVGSLNYPGGTVLAQGTTLIHELAHLLDVPGFNPDLGQRMVGENNDMQVEALCGNLIRSLQ